MTTARIRKYRAGACEIDTTSTYFEAKPADIFANLSPLLGRCVERIVNRHDGAEDWFFAADDNGPVEYHVAVEVER